MIGDRVIHRTSGRTGITKKLNGEIATVLKTDKDGNVINVDNQYIEEGFIRVPKSNVFITNVRNLILQEAP